MYLKNNWEIKLIKIAREIISHGWGRCELIVSGNGRRKTYNKTLTEVDEDEKKDLKII